MNTFGDRLRYARARLKWTQKKLAEASGLSQSAIGNYESGQRSSSRALLRLAQALNVSPVWLESGQAESPAGGYDRLALPAPGLRENAASGHGGPWPFDQVPYAHYQMLSPRDQQLLGNFVEDFIRTCLASYPPAGRTDPEP